MKQVHIFIAADPEQHEEYLEISNFVASLKERLEQSYQITISLHAMERSDPADWELEAYYKTICDSDMVFFLVFVHLPEAVRKGFDAALKSLGKQGTPKIYTYFKETDTEADRDAAVQNFMKMLDTELGHYYSTYSHIDTIKLRILLELKLNVCDWMQLEVEQNQLLMDGKHILPLGHVTAFVNNDQLRQWRDELEQTETEYFRMRRLYLAAQNDPKLCHEYSEIAAKRENLLKTIADTEKTLFEQSLRLYKDADRGELTARQREAYRLFEQGDFAAADELMDEEAIEREAREREKRREEEAKRDAQVYISQFRTKIEMKLARLDGPERIEEIIRLYEKIRKKVMEHQVSYPVLIGYVQFLYLQTRIEEALELGEALKPVFEQSEDILMVLNVLALIYADKIGCVQQAYDCYEHQLRLLKAFSQEKPEKYQPAMASCYSNLGVFYEKQGKPEEARRYYDQGMAVWKALCKKNRERFLLKLASVYVNAGSFYARLGEPQTAESRFRDAIIFFDELCAGQPEKFMYERAFCYNAIGAFYKGQNQTEKAKENIERAIGLRIQLSNSNPERYLPDLAGSYGTAGNLYSDLNDLDQAKWYFEKELEIYHTLGDPECFSYELAKSYHNLGLVYVKMHDMEKAEVHLKHAIELLKQYSDANPERYESELATVYGNAAVLYRRQKRMKDAEQHYRLALEIRERLYAQDQNWHAEALSASYHNMAVFYMDQSNMEQAEYYIMKAVKFREALCNRNPDKYVPYLVQSYLAAFLIYGKQKNTVKMSEYEGKMYESARKQPEHPICQNILQSFQKISGGGQP